LRFFIAFAQGDHDGRELVRFVLRELGRGQMYGLDENQVAELRKWMLGGLGRMAGGLEWVISSAELGTFSIVHGSDRSHYEGGAAVPKLLLCALLDGANWRIGRCAWPDCGRIFVRKGRGEYCSKECSQRMRTRRFRDPDFRKQEVASKVRNRAAIEPAPKRAKRMNRRSLEAALKVADITRADINRAARKLEALKAAPKENAWAADVAEMRALEAQKRDG
jgi:CGNR zinc finger